jgi:hypothetical protein
MICGGLGRGEGNPEIASARSDVDKDERLLHCAGRSVLMRYLATLENRCLCKIASHGPMLRILQTAKRSALFGAVRARARREHNLDGGARFGWRCSLLCARLLQARQAQASIASSRVYMSCARRRPVDPIHVFGADSEAAHVQGRIRRPPRRV